MESVNFDVKNMQSVIKSLFNQTISAIKSIKVSSNSYSDNRNISIRGDSRDYFGHFKTESDWLGIIR